MATIEPNAIGAIYPGRFTLAYGIFAAFLLCVFLLNGAAANAVVVATFVSAWALTIAENRAGSLSMPPVAPIALVFLAAISARLIVPPYGDDVIPGSAITRALLLLGLYGLTWYVYARLPFTHILWMVVGAASVCAAISIALYLYDPPADYRLTFLGRAAHPIIGAGAVSCGVIAGIALLAYGRTTVKARATLASMCVVILAGIYLTGSRGPMLALALALVLTPFLLRSASWKVVFLGAIAAWAVVTLGVVLEAPIQAALCQVTELACRPSLRHDVWMASLDLVATHPLWGSGYAFRFDGIPHAHNGYLGLALHYGIPILILFLWLQATAFRSINTLPKGGEKFFIVAALVFANGFMGTDLSDPMRFFNTHYVFLWMPLFFALQAGRPDQPAADRSSCDCPQRKAAEDRHRVA